MPWTVFLIVTVIWAMGSATFQTLGGFMHFVLFFALATPAIDLLRARGF